MENHSFNNPYLVGNELLDAQHKVILSYMSKVYAYLLTGKNKNDLFELLDKLDTYCKLHFLDEENGMEEMGYPEISDHKAQHALFVTHLENFLGRYEEQNSTRNIDELEFLKSWFMEHIETCDIKYGEYKKHPTRPYVG